MNLYLVQHAEAREKSDDPRRPLTDSGIAAIDKTARLLAAKVRPSVNFIIHSGKLRARQTAEILADYVTPIGGLKAVDGLAPNDDVSAWAGQLQAITEDVMLVGHLPHLGKLAARLLCGEDDCEIVRFTNAGIVCLERNDEGCWTVQWLIVPGLCE